MDNNKNNSKKLHRFSSTNQPAVRNGGRPPSYLKQFIKEKSLSIADVTLLLRSVLFCMNKKEITQLASNTDIPIALQLFAKALLHDFNNGSLNNFETLMKYAYGKPKETVEVKGQVDVTAHTLTFEEQIQRSKAILAEIESRDLTPDIKKIAKEKKPTIKDMAGNVVKFVDEKN